jgi:hypothetical protein
VTVSRKTVFWVAVCTACVVTLAGTAVAVAGYFASTGPGQVVREYFAALSRGDARAALGYGTVPNGPRDLLTAPVLRAQQQEGRIGPAAVIAVSDKGDTAVVSVHYTITFDSGLMSVVDDRVTLIEGGRSWRLAQTAVPVDLTLRAAQHRATVAGAAIPAGLPLVFPGVAPIMFDTKALQLGESGRVVRFADQQRAALEVTVSPAGRSVVTEAVAGALRTCLSSPKPDPLCPMPTTGRAVPGTVRGAPVDPDAIAANLLVTVSSDPDGRLDVTGRVPITGSFVVLSFDNQWTTKQMSRYPLAIRAHASAVTPTDIVWDAS